MLKQVNAEFGLLGLLASRLKCEVLKAGVSYLGLRVKGLAGLRLPTIRILPGSLFAGWGAPMSRNARKGVS